MKPDSFSALLLFAVYYHANMAGGRLVIDVEPIDVSEVRYRNDQSCGVSLYLTVFLIVQYKVDIYELLGQIGKKII